jgi:small subunit ribosomal protein S16
LAVVIRLKRGGGKKEPHYRIVVADSRKARDGKIIEKLGYYDPKNGQEAASVDRDRANYWLSQGARMSDTVRSIFKKLHV